MENWKNGMTVEEKERISGHKRFVESCLATLTGLIAGHAVQLTFHRSPHLPVQQRPGHGPLWYRRYRGRYTVPVRPADCPPPPAPSSGDSPATRNVPIDYKHWRARYGRRGALHRLQAGLGLNVLPTDDGVRLQWLLK